MGNCMKLLEQIVMNIRDNPEKDKYRRIKRKVSIFHYEGSKRFLEALGFAECVENGQGYLVMANVADRERLMSDLAVALDCLDNAKMYS